MNDLTSHLKSFLIILYFPRTKRIFQSYAFCSYIFVCFHDSRRMRSYGMHAIIRLSKADGKEKSGTDGIKEWKWLFNRCYARALRFLTFPPRFTFASVKSESGTRFRAALVISEDSRISYSALSSREGRYFRERTEPKYSNHQSQIDSCEGEDFTNFA